MHGQCTLEGSGVAGEDRDRVDLAFDAGEPLGDDGLAKPDEVFRFVEELELRGALSLPLTLVRDRVDGGDVVARERGVETHPVTELDLVFADERRAQPKRVV